MPRQDAGQDEDVQRLNTSPLEATMKEPAALQDLDPKVRRALDEARPGRAEEVAPLAFPYIRLKYQEGYNTLQSRLLAILSSPDSRSDLEWRKVLIDALSVASTKVL